MNARAITRITNAGLVAGVGMGGGHLLMPTRATAGLTVRLVFLFSLIGTGALAGWRERRAREIDGDEDIRGAESVWVAGGAVITVALAWLANRLVHG